MRAEPPRCWTTPDQQHSRARYRGCTAGGSDNWPLTSHNAITMDLHDTYDRRHYRVREQQRKYALMADTAAEASLEGHLSES